MEFLKCFVFKVSLFFLIGKKDYQNAEKLKKQIVNKGIYEEFWISDVYIC